ncbi:MAG: NAD(P)-dependent oxidoreductase [Bacillota bacterium]
MVQQRRINRPKVFYTHWAPPDGPSLLRPFCRVSLAPFRRPPTAEEIIAGAQDAFALCVCARDRITGDVIKRCRQLKVISSFARGYDNIDVDVATDLGIWVACVSEILAEPTADMTWALLLALARKVLPGDKFVRSGRFRGWEPRPRFPGLNVFGKTLGIIGMGQIGQAVARRGLGFSMRILYWQPNCLSASLEQALGVTWVTKEELLALSDFVCVCSPLTQATYHQIGYAELRLMKPTALLVNTSRGSQVDEVAVAEALRAGRLGGYAADVFEMEDYVPNRQVSAIPECLLGLRERTVFTPHASTAIAETRAAIARAQAQAILDVLEGRRPSGAVNVPVQTTGVS